MQGVQLTAVGAGLEGIMLRVKTDRRSQGIISTTTRLLGPMMAEAGLEEPLLHVWLGASCLVAAHSGTNDRN